MDRRLTVGLRIAAIGVLSIALSGCYWWGPRHPYGWHGGPGYYGGPHPGPGPGRPGPGPGPGYYH